MAIRISSQNCMSILRRYFNSRGYNKEYQRYQILGQTQHFYL